MLEKAVLASNGAVKMVKVNIDDNQAIAGQLRVQSIQLYMRFIMANQSMAKALYLILKLKLLWLGLFNPLVVK